MKSEQRFFVDLRSGIGAVRDRLHPYYDPEYNGLHSDTPDVIEHRTGYKDLKTGAWIMEQEAIDFLNEYCNSLNEKEEEENPNERTISVLLTYLDESYNLLIMSRDKIKRTYSISNPVESLLIMNVAQKFQNTINELSLIIAAIDDLERAKK